MTRPMTGEALKPTLEMRLAGLKVLHGLGYTGITASDMWPVYRAMCAASPPAPAAEAVAYVSGYALAMLKLSGGATASLAKTRLNAGDVALYTHPLDAATVRAEARREAFAQAIVAAKGCAWVAFNEEEAKACEVLLGDIVETIAALADKGGAE